MKHPLGRHWRQPDRAEILIDDTHAVMERDSFLKLSQYSATNPTGVYPGKMWSAFVPSQPGAIAGKWYLCWYSDCDDPLMCAIHRRQILFITPQAA